MNDFGFDKLQLEAQARKEWRQTDSIIVDPENIVSRSRDKERKEIVAILLNHQASDGELLVIPIVGMGGLGKTTLAQLIYNDPQVKEQFQLLKWVCVSDDFNVCNLANKICNESEKTLEKALNKLQEHLRGKRYYCWSLSLLTQLSHLLSCFYDLFILAEHSVRHVMYCVPL